MPFNQKDTIIVVTSDEPLGKEGNLHQHYVDILSQTYSLIFVAPPTKWSIRKLFSMPVVTTVESLQYFNYHNFLPSGFLPRFTCKINDHFNCRIISRLIPSGKQLIFWKFDSTRMISDYPLKPLVTIYHVRDPYFGRFSDKLLAKAANLVVTVNSAFIPHYEKLNSRVLFVPHGVRMEDTIVDEAVVQRIQDKFGNFFLMAGSVNNDLDFELLIEIVECFPEYTLLLVGTNALTDVRKKLSFEKLLKLPNVIYSGVVDYRELKNYISAAKVCLVAYANNRKNFFRNPIKITNYLAQLKPIVNTVEIPELKELEGKIVFSSSHKLMFIELIRDIIESRIHVDVEFVKSYIRRNDYRILSNQILEAAEMSQLPNAK